MLSIVYLSNSISLPLDRIPFGNDSVPRRGRGWSPAREAISECRISALIAIELHEIPYRVDTERGELLREGNPLSVPRANTSHF